MSIKEYYPNLATILTDESLKQLESLVKSEFADLIDEFELSAEIYGKAFSSILAEAISEKFSIIQKPIKRIRKKKA